MKYISIDEFDCVYRQLHESGFTCYDALLAITDKVTKKFVYKQCNCNPALSKRGYEEDIMQEVRLKVIKNCVHGFFLRNGEDNYNPSGFVAWLFKVAENVVRDYAKKVNRFQFREAKEISECYDIPCQNDLYVSTEVNDDLSTAVKVAFDCDYSVYKVLTWIAMMLFMVNLNIEKFETPDIIDKTFSQMTLFQMYDTIVVYSKCIPWLELDDDRKKHIKEKLSVTFKDGRRVGDMIYSDFYMKKGPKATISDWVNRVNKYIVKEVQK